MTRINLIPPEELTDPHLMAEYRELAIVPAALKRSLRTQSKDTVMKKIPKEFTLNKGHVTFFYDKLHYLSTRYQTLIKELSRRGYNLDPTRSAGFDGIDPCWFGDYTPSTRDMDIVRERIALRISQKPDWYESRTKKRNSHLG